MNKKILSAVLSTSLLTGSIFAVSTTAFASDAELSLAYQYGLAYAPAVIAQQKGFIEEAYKENGGGELTVNWNQMSSGADINVGIASGELDAGFMGLGPAITGVTKGVGYRIFSNLSGQRHGMMSNDPEVDSLEDLVGSDKQIALVNIGSFQHIILAKALADNGFDPHALDANIVVMAHPDGMTALTSGSATCHLTSSPYIFMEEDAGTFTEVPEVNEAWGVDKSFIVGVASEALHDESPELYEALCDGIKKGMDFLLENPEEAAALLCELDGNTAEVEQKYLEMGSYQEETNGIFDLATFMADNQFIENAPESYEDLVFDNVKGN